MKHKILFLTLSIITIFIIPSCTHDSTSINELPEISFSKEVLPIFQTGCATSNCHDELTATDDEVYTNYQNISSSVDPGNPDNSKSYRAITNNFEIMPPERPLSIEDRTKIRVWILQGAKNN